jgi:hypothetical protein
MLMKMHATLKEIATLEKTIYASNEDLKTALTTLLVSRPDGDHMALAGLLPTHLAQTYLVVKKLGKASAREVAVETGKARAVESHYLNMLVTMGYLLKARHGKVVVFFIKP